MTMAPNRPGVSRIIVAAVAFGLALGIVTAFSLSWRFGWGVDMQITRLGVMFGLGGALSIATSSALVWWLIPRASPLWRITTIALLTLFGALFFTAVMLTLDYRTYYGQWHAPPFTRPWIWQQAFTAAGIVYQYIVIGPRLYGPAGLVLLVAASWWVGRPAR